MRGVWLVVPTRTRAKQRQQGYWAAQGRAAGFKQGCVCSLSSAAARPAPVSARCLSSTEATAVGAGTSRHASGQWQRWVGPTWRAVRPPPAHGSPNQPSMQALIHYHKQDHHQQSHPRANRHARSSRRSGFGALPVGGGRRRAARRVLGCSRGGHGAGAGHVGDAGRGKSRGRGGTLGCEAAALLQVWGAACAHHLF